MAKHINIKTEKPQLFGRAPLLINKRHSESAKAIRYYKYQVLLNNAHPTKYKPIKVQSVAQQMPAAVESELKQTKTKWADFVPHWIVELFTRDKSNQEILSTGTA